ncbi:hypothetical protein [Ferruginibacter sp. HRS2-29]|uniref:hypothetical protein n=1 Tax=Ferruginibacter sp. HRS2-29 TaxID=2487334 RepID=UPI0020CD9187|nr:hypothetical protein [Ferruginibacter sp. HRS2-29]MCP9750689.1 hypothetical protein [Ferruginibacter sp. HRS2-29]MCP9751551.1 hypothetical protein [Ferruginibacter sp. HRS2-29]MCP9752654.1 hypothetical protein [Ferruginibacter sp. HRS2-29]
MNYSLLKLETIEACDQKLAELTLEKEDLNVKRVQLVRRHTAAEVTAPQVTTQIAEVQLEINGLDAMIATYPDGDLKNEYLAKRSSKVARLNALTQRLEGFNDMALLDQEYEVNCIDRSLVETDVFIAAINGRKAEL